MQLSSRGGFVMVLFNIMKNLTIILGVVIALLVLIWILVLFGPNSSSSLNSAKKDDAASISLADIKSFDGCIEAGYPALESWPRRCNTPDGRSFTEEIDVQPTYVNASSDLIKIELPYPGAVTGKSFKIIGEARGNWYFEASFPIEVLDKNNKVLVTTYATAQSDWMTTDFVTYNVDIEIPESYSGPATIVLMKDNPSGLSENDALMSVPITIEY